MRKKTFITIFSIVVFAILLGACSKILIEDEKPVEKITIYFYNSLSWEHVNLEIEENNKKVLAEPLTMEKEETTSWYTATILKAAINKANAVYLIFSGPKEGESIKLATKGVKNIFFSLYDCYTSKALALEAIDRINNKIVRVYFYNNYNWDRVAVICTGIGENNLYGNLATKDTDPNWYYIDVYADPTVTPFAIYFSDTLMRESRGVTIRSFDGVYVTVNGYMPFASKEQAEESEFVPIEVYIYFYSKNAWEDVGIYGIWDNEIIFGANNTESMLSIGGGWYYYILDFYPSETPLNIVVYNKVVESEKTEVYINKDVEVYFTINNQLFSSPQAVIEYFKILETKTRVSFNNSLNWESVYVHANNNNGILEQRELTESEDNWYSIDIDQYQTYIDCYVQFYNGLAENPNDQTEFIHVTIPNAYICLGIDYAFDNKEAPESYLANDETTLYFFDSESFGHVYIYLYGSVGEYFGEQPGKLYTEQIGKNLYEVKIPFDTMKVPVDIKIFFDGEEVGGLTVSGRGKYFNALGQYGTLEEAVSDTANYVEFYFYNEAAFPVVYACMIGDRLDESNEMPGYRRYPFKGTNWYTIDILELDLPYIYIYEIVFNNHGKDIPEDQWQEITYTNLDINKPYLAYGLAFETKEEADSFVRGELTTIYFYNNNVLKKVAAMYAFGEYLTDYPGVLVTEVEDKWFAITIPVNPLDTPITVTFYDPDSDKKVIVVIDNLTEIYVATTGKFTSMDDAVGSYTS